MGNTTAAIPLKFENYNTIMHIKVIFLGNTDVPWHSFISRLYSLCVSKMFLSLLYSTLLTWGKIGIHFHLYNKPDLHFRNLISCRSAMLEREVDSEELHIRIVNLLKAQEFSSQTELFRQTPVKTVNISSSLNMRSSHS